MKRMKKWMAVFTAAALIGTMAGCSATTEATSDESSGSDTKQEQETKEAKETKEATGTTEVSEKTSDGDFKVGFAQCTMASPFYASMVDAASAYAKEIGVEFTYVSADDDVTKQNNDINDMISSGIDALILNPINAEGVKPALEACEKAGIPVITVDRNISEGQTAYVGRDNEKMGNMVGQALVEHLGGKESAKGKILEIQGTAGDTVMMARRDGFEAAIKEAPGLEVIQSAYCDYTRSKAITAVQDMLQANPDIVAVYGHNDDMSLGAAQVLQEKGIENVAVTGVDGLMEAVIAIEGGTYAITTMNDPGALIKAALDTCVKVLNGESYEEYVDGGTAIIDANNAAEYVNKDLPFAAMK